MNELINKKCEACRIDAPKVSNEEIPILMSQIPLWDVIEENNIKKLTCLFKFSDYEQSLVFTNKVATLADEEDHHPKLPLSGEELELFGGLTKFKAYTKMILYVLPKQIDYTKIN